MLLYPRLPMTVSRQLALERSTVDIATAAKASATAHAAAIYAPTGGARASESHLAELQRGIRGIAEQHGLPQPPTRPQARQFDVAAAEYLHRNMKISPGEASNDGVWQFVTLILLPDVARWRFAAGEEGTAVARLLGGVRNVLGRLWWRAFLLCDSGVEQPYTLLSRLSEDELVQLMERPSLAGNARLTRTTATMFLQILDAAARKGKKVNRMLLMREAQKRVMRLLPLTCFEILSDSALRKVIQSAFQEAIKGIVSLQRTAVQSRR